MKWQLVCFVCAPSYDFLLSSFIPLGLSVLNTKLGTDLCSFSVPHLA